MKTKMFASVLAVLMLLTAVVISPVSADEAGLVIKAEQVTVPNGQEAMVSVSVEGDFPADGIASVRFNTRVAGATIISGEAAENLPGLAEVGPTDKSANDGVNFMWATKEDALKADTVLVTFKVALPDKAKCGASYDVVVTLSTDADDFIAGDNTTVVAATAANGKVTVVHAISHVEAVAATCTEAGNVEHYYCTGCKKYFTDADASAVIENIVVPATGHTIEHVAAAAAGCTEPGNIDHYHCSGCGLNFADPGAAIVRDNVSVPAIGSHALKHVEAVDPAPGKDGNIEHWVCTRCNAYFKDAEGQEEITAEEIVIKAPDYTLGDVNGDNRVNAKDIIAVMKFMLGNTPEGFIEAAGDLNNDNRINAKDIILIMKIMLGGK